MSCKCKLVHTFRAKSCKLYWLNSDLMKAFILNTKEFPQTFTCSCFFSNFVAKLIVSGFTCALRSCSPIRFLNAIVCQEKRTISTDYQSTDNSYKVIFYIDTYHDHSNFCTVRRPLSLGRFSRRPHFKATNATTNTPSSCFTRFPHQT